MIYMQRIARTIKIDSRVLKAIERLAEKTGTSANNYIENLLLAHAKTVGEMSMDSEILPDNRGGKREGGGRKKKPTEPAKSTD